MKHPICYSLIIAALCASNAAFADNIFYDYPASSIEGQSLPTDKNLPRGEAPASLKKNLPEYVKAIKKENVNMHIIMVVQHGKVIAEQWFGDGKPDVPHILNSVSKSFT